MDVRQYADLFLSESRDHLTAMNLFLPEWEHGPAAREPVGGIFRALSSAILASRYEDCGQERDHVFCVEAQFVFAAEPETLRGHFLLVPDLGSWRAILQAVRLT